MRYQERIYIQNENRAVRNKGILNVNMSSDFCIFKSPSFDVSAATKVQCGPIVCNLSGFSSEDILSAATYNCFTSQSMSGSCFSSVTWTTKIYEDNALSYSASYYTATALTGDTPSDQTFFNSLTTGLYKLGYTYDFIDNILTVQKQYGGAKELEYDLCLTWVIKPATFSCPVGFTATPANDACQRIISSAATFNGLGTPISAGKKDNIYSYYGTYFYPSIANNLSLPVYYTGDLGPLKDSSGGTITPSYIVSGSNTFWSNNPATSINGRLNNVGLSATTSEYRGFSKCIDIPYSGTYYVGIAADNNAKFKIDGTTYVNFSGSQLDNFRKWSIFEFKFTSGLHIIEMEGIDTGAPAAFGAEIYYPTGATPFATLTAATSTASTQANAIFSTAEYVGKYWDLGTTVGYSCTSGYSFNICDPLNPICTKIETTGITSSPCTGVCSADCTTICADTFPNLTNTSKGIYILDTEATIPLSFNFTGNTDVFTATSASFKYEVYKYNRDLGVFAVPPVYKSNVSQYYSFSATNILQQSLSISGLSLDGDYLIKGYYEANACTDFLNKLGKRIDTLLYNRTGTYQLYEPETDFYFVGTTKAESPTFAQSQTNDLEFYDALPLYQQVIIVDDTIVYSQYVDADNNEQLSPTYERTGATFTLVSEYLGDIFVTLNGLTLAKDIDYSLSGYVLTLYDAVRQGDIITIVYTRTSTQTLVSNAIQITNAIASGTTNNEGSNKAYYNTTTGKYELYTDNQILDGSRIILILNGITLTFNIDYYLSKTNKKRIILQGTIMVDDIINIIYYPIANVVNGITNNNNNINWYITTPPEKSNGEFLLEYSNSSSFSTYTVNSTVPYAPQVTNYTSVLSLTGSVGTNWYYRVKNIKNYQSICGDMISSTGYSETVRVKIQSNAINSY